MRKLILISALLLASAASVQAGETRSLSLAGATEPAKPIAEVSMQLAQAATAPTETTAQPQATTTTTEPKAEPKPEKVTETKPAKPVKKARRESSEQKARRIAARYGVYW